MSNFNDIMNQQGLGLFLDMDDSTFAAIYPSVKEELQRTFKSAEFATALTESAAPEAKLALATELKELLAELPQSTEFSIEKKDFLTLIMNACLSIVENLPIRDTVAVFIEYCRDTAREPSYAHLTDAGCDVYAAESGIIKPGETVIVPTGLKIAVPVDWMLSVRPRSGLSAKTKIRVANAPGTIDAGYRDEIGIILTNTDPLIDFHYEVGDRIAQFVIERAPMIRFNKVENIAEIGENRDGGFGSTGK